MGARTALLTVMALVAFAANSLLCRGALGPRTIDPATFTLVRIASGAATLAVLTRLRGGAPALVVSRSEIGSPAALFAYAIAFSIAYLRLPTGTGALILFGAVQVTMIVAAVRAGDRPSALAWVGMVVAVVGLVGLTLPGLGAPDPLGAMLMAAAGVAWGLYTLRGRGSTDPLASTAKNFVSSVPLALAAFVVALAIDVHARQRGVVLAAISGAAASGLGYAVWYTALRGLTPTRAAVVQLSVPVIAAAGGIVLLGETLTARLVLSATAILGGVACVVLAR